MSKMPFSCEPVSFTLSTRDPHRVIHRLTADHIHTDTSFSIPAGPWEYFMFAAADSSSELCYPFLVTWSSEKDTLSQHLFPKRWYSAPCHGTHMTLHFHHFYPFPYGIILLLVRSANDVFIESKRLMN